MGPEVSPALMATSCIMTYAFFKPGSLYCCVLGAEQKIGNNIRLCITDMSVMLIFLDLPGAFDTIEWKRKPEGAIRREIYPTNTDMGTYSSPQRGGLQRSDLTIAPLEHRFDIIWCSPNWENSVLRDMSVRYVCYRSICLLSFNY